METALVLDQLSRLCEAASAHPDTVRVHTLTTLHHGSERYPLLAFDIGTRARQAPSLLITAGVHGLERIGSEIVLAHLASVLRCLSWDRCFRSALQHVRLLSVPVVNPIGIMLRRRSNGSGVDLMRNAPIDSAAEESRWRLYRGHRYTSRLPWYRGTSGMEPETQNLCDFVERELFPSRFAVSLDVHSGFVGRDRLWFPYASSRRPPADIADLMALKTLLDESHPNHRYQMEPQSIRYTAHGDVWDYLYDLHGKDPHPPQDRHPRKFLPLTLELGASSWIRKNPLQIFSASGLFHPIKPHRVTRLLRRHGILFDFLLRAVYSHGAWEPTTGLDRQRGTEAAYQLWPFEANVRSRP